jgi:RHS repeat-associated protein
VLGSVSRTWNSDFRIATESVNGGSTVLFTYDPDGLITGAGALTVSRNQTTGLITGTNLGGVADVRQYDTFGEPTSYVANYGSTPILMTQDTFDSNGRISNHTEIVGTTEHSYDYGYDLGGRLLTVATDGTATASYTYDLNGNRLSKTTPNGSLGATYDAQDRLLTYGPVGYGYTENGEVATKTDTTNGQVTGYAYDAVGNLRSVTLPDGRLIEYLIDGMNRRIGKKINGQLVKGWVYRNSLKVVAELDANSTVVARFVYGTTGLVPAYMVKNGVTYRIISSRQGTPRRVVDVATGLVAQSVDTDEFGDAVTDTSPGFQPFGIGGGLYDPDTRLIRLGARDYDPATGRWISKDPARLAFSTQMYSFVDGDPINRLDPTGLGPRDQWYGFNDRDFQQWVHRGGNKDPGQPDFTKDELEQLYEDWQALGKPGGDKRNKPRRDICEDPPDATSDPDEVLDGDSDPVPEPDEPKTHKFEGTGPWWEDGSPVNPPPFVPGVISPPFSAPLPPFVINPIPGFGPILGL